MTPLPPVSLPLVLLLGARRLLAVDTPEEEGRLDTPVPATDGGYAE